MSSSIKLKKIDEYTWEIPKGTVKCMKVSTIVYADNELLNRMREDLTLMQGANIACLPGVVRAAYIMPDGHQGYGFPIGGVAATSADEGIISPGGVGYDINCLAPDTRVLTDHGYWVKVKELPQKFKLLNLKVYNPDEGHNDASNIAFVAEREVEDDEIAIRITTESGRVIEGSEDHPVLTPVGYTYLKNIKEGDFVIVYPFEGVEYEERKGIILDESAFKDEQVLSFLRERNLIPLRWENPEIGTIARILGFALGDGHLGEVSGRITLTFYGKEETLKELKKDLERLGINANLYVRERNYSIETMSGYYERRSAYAELRVTSRSFALFLERLGLPRGKKINKAYRVPKWIMEAPLWVKRNFLAGLFAADGSTVEFKGTTPLPINITQSKDEGLSESLFQFLGDIAKLLAEFGIKTTIYKVKSKKNVTYRLSIVEEESVRAFVERINYEYDLKKKAIGLIAAAYLKLKEIVREERRMAIKKVRKVYERTESIKEAYKAVKDVVNRRFVEKGIYEGYREPRVPEDFPTFEEFIRERGYEGGFVAERIIKIERIKPSYNRFYDIGVYHRAHNFIADGIVVHNCGVRLMSTNLEEKDVRNKLKELVDNLFVNVPSGVGSKGKLRLSMSELDEVLSYGAQWAVEKGFGWDSDIEHIESRGRIPWADPTKVSNRAKSRGAPQLGTLGAGNHFLEVQVVDKIYNPEIAKVFGLDHEGQVTVMVHTGSRGLGHQVASDYLMIMEKAMKKYGIHPPDRELASVPFNSKEGQDYFHAMGAAANFGFANRQLITHWVREAFGRTFKTDPENLGLKLIYGLAHNIAKLEEHEVNGKRMKLVVHRKGATRAFPPGHPEIPSAHRSVGQVVLIPGSMGTASYVMAGVPEGAKTFYTSAHGAGRWMSRHKALRQYNAGMITSELTKKGIYVHAATKRVLVEEAPEAYKDVDRVALVTHKVKIATLVARLRPLGVVKG